MCKNPDVKCAAVERDHRTIHDGLYKYFTNKNTYRYIDVLPKFVKVYNETVHSNTGIAPSRVADLDVLVIWRRMEAKRRSVRVTKAKFCVGEHVSISKEKMKFAKSAEQNLSTEISKIVKVIDTRPRAIYEIEDLNGAPIHG